MSAKCSRLTNADISQGVITSFPMPTAISEKPMQLESPNVTQECSTIGPGNLFILVAKLNGQSHGHKNLAGVGLSAGFFSLLCLSYP